MSVASFAKAQNIPYYDELNQKGNTDDIWRYVPKKDNEINLTQHE